MIQVCIYMDKDKRCKGFTMSGHAEYDDLGKDIVCSAVSILTFNTINSVEAFTKDKFEFDSDEEKGYIKVDFIGDVSHDTELLMSSFALGIESIIKDGNYDYIKMTYKEV